MGRDHAPLAEESLMFSMWLRFFAAFIGTPEGSGANMHLQAE